MPGFEPRHGGDISQTGRQRIPDRWSDEAERALTKRFQIVTAVARKRPRSFCQKRRWQVTAKHAHTLRMWLCMK